MADFKVKYASPATITIGLASLATSSDRTVGRESDAIDNGTNLYVDVLVSGKVTTGTSPTASKQIDICVYAAHDETPTYPDVLDGADSAETMTSANVRAGAVRVLASLRVDNTSNQTYWLAPSSVARAFGGVLPRRWGLFVAHDTGVNLHATSGNHEFKYTGITYQSV
jgi:hypothetical protein